MPTWEEIKKVTMKPLAKGGIITDLNQIQGLKMTNKIECPFCHNEILLVVNVRQCAIDLLIGLPDVESKKPIRAS